MFQFLMGVAFGAAGYWAWQSFGRDLLGMGSDQETTYGGFSSGTSGSPSTFGTGSTNSSSSTIGSTSEPTTSSGSSTSPA
jgi:hypothetical protein